VDGNGDQGLTLSLTNYSFVGENEVLLPRIPLFLDSADNGGNGIGPEAAGC